MESQITSSEYITYIISLKHPNNNLTFRINYI
jgi:hypothetical protein